MSAVKAAVTVRFVFKMTVQLPVPGQVAGGLPLTVGQLVNSKPGFGVAVNVIEVPLFTVSVQSVPQFMPVPVMVPSEFWVTVRVRRTRLKLAVIVRLTFKVTVQVPVPGQEAEGLPVIVHPVNVAPVLGVAVSVICVPLLTVSAQSLLQFTPGPVTVPLPLPVLVTLRLRGTAEKATDTVRLLFRLAVHCVPVVGLQPVQLANENPGFGVAVKVMAVPLLTVSEQSLPQLMPVPVMVPLAFGVTVSVRRISVKLAVTVRLLVKVMVQVPVPGQALGFPVTVQPLKFDPPFGAAVSVIAVPLLTVSEQSFPQLMPVPVTVPLPFPVFMTVRVC